MSSAAADHGQRSHRRSRSRSRDRRRRREDSPKSRWQSNDIASRLAGSGDFDGVPERWGKSDDEPKGDSAAPVVKEKPNFGLSGALARDTVTGNVFNGVVLKWSEPQDARKPTERWRIYVYKDGKEQQVLHLHRQSAFLAGRERRVSDIPLDNPSCSTQHAVVQFRLKEKHTETGERIVTVRPYVMDLKSTNGTKLNGKRIDDSRYIELLSGDMLQFGMSTREYVIICEGEGEDDA